ncbi:MAG: MauE/DoxX family redox-associated membrane protein [Myxococcota bacterium]
MALDPVVHEALRCSLALLFAAAAFHKLRDLPAFAATLGDYRLLPRAAGRPASVAVVAAEAAAAGALLLDLTPLGPALACTLLALYAGAIGWNLARGRRHIDCGCTGPLGRRQTLAPWLLWRNAVLCGAALLLLVDTASRAVSWLDAPALLGSVAFLALLWNAIPRLGAVAGAAPPGRPA